MPPLNVLAEFKCTFTGIIVAYMLIERTVKCVCTALPGTVSLRLIIACFCWENFTMILEALTVIYTSAREFGVSPKGGMLFYLTLYWPLSVPLSLILSLKIFLVLS